MDADAFIDAPSNWFKMSCVETAVILVVQADVDEMVAAVGFSSLQVIPGAVYAAWVAHHGQACRAVKDVSCAVVRS